MKNITTMKIDEENRNWLESLKRKFRFESLNEAVFRIRKVFTKLKLSKELEIKQ